MPDRPDHDADRLDAFLNAEGDERASDDLTAFADRVMRAGSLPIDVSTEPNRSQRERIRAQGLEDARSHSMEEPPMMTPTLNANGSQPTTPMPIQQEEATSASWFSMLTTAALIAIIGVASFGLMRGSFDFMPNVAGPDPTGAPGIAGSPETLSASDIDCDIDGQVYIFADAVPDIDALDTAVRLDADGTLTLLCDGEETVIASGVLDAASLYWPGVIVMALDDDTLRLLNLTNDRSLDLQGAHLFNDGRLDLTTAFVRTGAVDPWALTPVNADHTDWRIIDVRSMQSFLLSDELGARLPRAFTPSFGHITGTDVAVLSWHEPLPNLPSTPQPGGTNGIPPLGSAALVLPGSIENRHWITVLNWNTPLDERTPWSQVFSVSHDGSLLAYTTVVENGDVVIRVEDTGDGTHVVDVPIGERNLDMRFILAGNTDRLLVADGKLLRLYELDEGEAQQTVERPDPGVEMILPTGDPDTFLLSHNNGNTSVTPFNVITGEKQERYRYIPSANTQLFGDDELPANIVRIASDSAGDVPSTIQLVDVSTGGVLLESDPIDVHPLQMLSFYTALRNGGSVAVVPIGYNRAIVMDANAGEVWEIEAPIEDDRLWRFSLTSDGEMMTAWPDPALGTTEYVEGHIAPLEPDPNWAPIEQGSGSPELSTGGTPAPPSG